MLTPLDKVLYSDDCEVLEIVPHNLFVYRIYKNASSSFSKEASTHNGRIFFNEEIQQIKNITVPVRPPIERFVAGAQKVCLHLKEKNPNLDNSTIMFFLENYLFWDRHLLPQFHWLLNLQRFADPNTVYSIRTVESFSNKLSANVKPNKLNIDVDVNKVEINLYLQLDTVLYNLAGQDLTFDEIVSVIKNDADSKFDDIIRLPKKLVNLL
jgi:hypothetical protein